MNEDFEEGDEWDFETQEEIYGGFENYDSEDDDGNPRELEF